MIGLGVGALYTGVTMAEVLIMARRLLIPVLALLAVVVIGAASSETALADPRDFTLINGHPAMTLTYAFVSPSDQTEWGEDVLGSDLVLAPGESVFIDFSQVPASTCLYDIRVIYADGSEQYRYSVNLCEIESVTFG